MGSKMHLLTARVCAQPTHLSLSLKVLKLVINC